MRTVLASLLSLVFFLSVHAQGYVWETVANPVVGMNHAGLIYGVGGQGQPIEPGNYTIEYAMVDRNNQQSPWSDPVTVTLTKGQYWYVDDREFIDEVSYDTIATVWRINGSFAAKGRDGVGPFQVGAKYGWTPIYPGVFGMVTQVGYQFTAPSLLLTAKPKKPVTHLSNVPNVNLEFMYVWCCNTGETESSPVEVSPKSQFMDGPVGVPRYLNLYNCQPPVGALGYRIYGRKQGTQQWYRQAKPEYRGGREPNANDFLWPVGNLQPVIMHWREVETPQPAKVKQSKLTTFQKNLKYTGNPYQNGGKLTITEDQVIHCPIFDADKGPIAADVNGNYYKFWLDVQGNGCNVWKDSTPLVHPVIGQCPDMGSCWPMMAITNQKSTWTDLRLHGELSEGVSIRDSIGVSLFDYYGGCVFNNTLERFVIDNVDHGIYMPNESCFGTNQHAASEFKLIDSKVNAWINCYRMDCNQSAGNEVLSLRKNSELVVGSSKWYASIFRIESASVFSTRGKINVDGPVVFMLGQSSINTERIWLDQGCQVFANCMAYYTGHVSVRGEKLNLWKDCWLYKNPCGTGQTILRLTDVDFQASTDPANKVSIFTNRYNGVTPIFEGSPKLADRSVLYQPSYDDWVSTTNCDYVNINGQMKWVIPAPLTNRAEVKTVNHNAATAKP